MDYQPLTQSKINTIESVATEVLRSVFGDTDRLVLPVRVTKILEAYGLDLKGGTFPDESVSGMFDKSDRTIYIATGEPLDRTMFTMAHELGHFFLHESKKTDVFYRLQIFRLTEEDNTLEKEANWFAASLLMPDKRFRHYASLTHDLEELASIFGVSVTAVYYRLKNLGLLR